MIMGESNADLFASLLDDEDVLTVSNDLLKKPKDDVFVTPNAGVESTDAPPDPAGKTKDCLKERKLNFNVDLFSGFSKEDEAKSTTKTEKSLVHTNDTDSSDDEENKYFENSKYNSFGKAIRNQLKQQQENSQNSLVSTDPRKSSGFSKTSSVSSNKKQIALPEKAPVKINDVYSDPVFGLRIISPLISSRGLQMKMEGKVAVSLFKLKAHMSKPASKDQDWVLAGVIVRSATKTSQNGNQYIIWDISDLKEQLMSVPVFLFGRSYTALWKTSVGSVIGILNPSASKKENSDTLSLTVNNPDQVMIWGTSKDFALCRAMKNNGEKCTSFVNRSVCEFCVYHIKKEYSKYSSSRSELQSPFGHRESLRNKVLGKNEVFYGGKSYTSVKPINPGRVKKVMSAKDSQRLTQLGITVIEKAPEPIPYSENFHQFSKGSQVMKQLNTNQQINGVNATKFLKPPANSLKMRSVNTNAKNSESDILKMIKSDPRSNGVKSKKIQEENSLNGVENSSSLKETAVVESFSPSGKNQKSSLSKEPLAASSNSKVKSQTDVTKVSGKKLNSPKTHKLSDPLTPNTKGKSSPLTSLAKTKTTASKGPRLTDPDFFNDGIPDAQTESSNLEDTKEKPSLVKQSNVDSSNVLPLKPLLSDPSKRVKTKSVPSPVNPLQTKFNSLFQVASVKKNASAKRELNKSQEDISPKDNLPVKSAAESSPSCDARSKMKPLSSSSPNEPESEKGVSKADIPETSFTSPKGGFSSGTSFSLNSGHTPSSSHARKMSSAKLRAIQVVKQQGVNPERKRKREIVAEAVEKDEDKTEKPVFSELFLELMNKTTAHLDLVESERLRKEEEYFERMGKKEELEEKMLNTFKIDCKAVKCLKCKYIWFSSSEVCKSEGHPIKVVDAVKRFFKCGNCGHRTVSLHILPLVSCKQCHQTSWLRAPMIREKVTKNVSQLSIRGGEQTFIHSSVTNTNIDLLVPDND